MTEGTSETTRPASVLERAMAQARQGSLDPGAVLWVLAAGPVVIAHEGEAQPGQFPSAPLVLSRDGNRFLGAFSHPDQLGSFGQGRTAMVIPSVELLRRIPEGVGLVVNPATSLGFEIPAQGLRAFTQELLRPLVAQPVVQAAAGAQPAAAQPAPAPPIPARSIPEEAWSDWARLCTLLDPSPTLPGAVMHSLTDPQGYFTAHQRPLLDRGITTAADVDPWLVLIDVLREDEALAYLDGKASADQLAQGLARLPRVATSGAVLDPVAEVDGDLPAALVRADEVLSSRGLRLLLLDEDSDAYAVAVVPTENVEEILAVALRLGQVAHTVG